MNENFDYKNKKIVIVGGGLLGTELEKQVSKHGGIPIILKKLLPNKKIVIPNDTDSIIIVAQSADYKSKILTNDIVWVNTTLPLIIIQQALSNNIKKLAYCSTGSVYNPSRISHKEDEMIAVNDLSPYVASKIAAENLIQMWKEYFDRLVIFRPFFIYGSKQREEMLVSKILLSIKNNQPIKLANKKGLIFNPIHVVDAAEFVLKSLEYSNGFDIFNIAGTEKISLNELVEKMSKILKKSPNIENTNDVENVVLGSIEKMKSIKFNHKIDVERGLLECIENKL